MSVTKTKYIVVGSILGAHGVRGDVRLKSFTADPEAIFDFGPLLSETGQTLLTPVSMRPAKQTYIVKPEETRSKEDWDSLKGKKLYVSRDRLPPAETDEFYVEDLTGLHVRDPDGGHIGYVRAVLNHGAGDLLEIEYGDAGRRVLIPFTIQDIPEINPQEGWICLSDISLWLDDSAE
ncbi:MAG: ribosome maturation factor RimM [Henriciella sp.]